MSYHLNHVINLALGWVGGNKLLQINFLQLAQNYDLHHLHAAANSPTVHQGSGSPTKVPHPKSTQVLRHQLGSVTRTCRCQNHPRKLYGYMVKWFNVVGEALVLQENKKIGEERVINAWSRVILKVMTL